MESFAEERDHLVRRYLGLLLSLLLIGLTAMPARAHDVVLLAAVTVQGDEVSVRLLDQLASSIPGAKVTLGTGVPAQKPSQTVTATEDASHLYHAKFSGTRPDVYQITVTAFITDMEFRTSVRAKVGENLSETMIPLVHIEKPTGPNWENILYITAAALLVIATAIALVKRRKSSRNEGGAKA